MMRRHNPLWSVRLVRTFDNGVKATYESIPMHAALAAAHARQLVDNEHDRNKLARKRPALKMITSTCKIDFVAVAP